MNPATGIEPIPVVTLVPPPPAPPPRSSWRRDGRLPAAVGWLWRFAAGVFLCLNVFPLSYVTAVAVYGWLMRWTQTIVLRGWWKQSPRRGEPFHAFCAALGPAGPAPRPRWFLHQHFVDTLNAPGPDGRPAGFFRTLGRFATLPVHSFGLNMALGLRGMIATYLLTGIPCLLMLFSWYFGWVNSFHKGYEDWWIGVTFGWLGLLLFVATLFYVPMAHPHQAAAGGAIAAFFQVGLVWRLIRARLTAYTALAALLALFSLLIEIPRLFVLSDEFGGNQEGVTPEQALQLLRTYFLACTVFFFAGVLIVRGVAARVYRSAVLRALRTGTISAEELPPLQRDWLTRLDLIPAQTAPAPGMIRSTIRWSYRRMLWAVLFLFWLLFTFRFYVGYFLVATDFRGFLHHPAVQLPCIDWTPWHLAHGRDE